MGESFWWDTLSNFIAGLGSGLVLLVLAGLFGIAVVRVGRSPHRARRYNLHVIRLGAASIVVCSLALVVGLDKRIKETAWGMPAKVALTALAVALALVIYYRAAVLVGASLQALARADRRPRVVVVAKRRPVARGRVAGARRRHVAGSRRRAQ